MYVWVGELVFWNASVDGVTFSVAPLLVVVPTVLVVLGVVTEGAPPPPEHAASNADMTEKYKMRRAIIVFIGTPKQGRGSAQVGLAKKDLHEGDVRRLTRPCYNGVTTPNFVTRL